MMKKFKKVSALVLAVVLLTVTLAGQAFASEDAAEDAGQAVENVQADESDLEAENITSDETVDMLEVEEGDSLTDEFSGGTENSEAEVQEGTDFIDGGIHYTTGGSAAGDEKGNAAGTESEASVLGSNVNIIPNFNSLYVGQSRTMQLSAGTTGTLTWTTSNDSVATVDASGTVTGIAKGFAVVRATDINGNFDAVKVFVGYYIGVDLDVYQGTLDADGLVNSGIDFAIIRRGYGNLEDTSQLDREFENTYSILKNAGIPVGAYLFNYFESTANAVEEAESLYPYLKDLDLELGVYSDFEEGGYYSSYEYYKRINGVYPTPAQITEMNTAFLETLKSRLDAETPVGYYSSMGQCASWYSNEFKNTYPLWAAYWRYKTDDPNEDEDAEYSVLFDKVNDWFQGYSYLTGNMVMHQYSSGETATRVGGSGWLDVDVIDMDSPLALRFVKVDAAVTNENAYAKISWEKPAGANNIDGYLVYRTVNETTEQIADVSGSESNSYTDTECINGASYSVKAYSQCGGTTYYSQDGNSAQYQYLMKTTIYNGVDYSAVYNMDYYYNAYADVRTLCGYDENKVIEHFVTVGMSEGRQASENFDPQSYYNRYRDLRKAYGQNWTKYYIHYIKYGKNQDRIATGFTKIYYPVTVYNGVNYSDVYDFEYYYSNNPELEEMFGYDDVAVLEYFVEYGMDERVRASEDFDVISYYNRYQDLRKAYGHNWEKYYLHYIRYGKKAGRVTTGYTKIVNPVTVYNGLNYSAVYDFEYYYSNYPELEEECGYDDIAVLEYFVTVGMNTGHQAKASFNAEEYKSNYADLQRAYGDNISKYYLHFIKYGKSQGRIGTGWKGEPVYDGIDYSAVYDFEYYYNRYSDLRKAYGNDEGAYFRHFLQYGMKEGRQAKSTFNVSVYKSNYSDLRKAYGSNLQRYYIHYIKYGQKEGRKSY